MIEAFLRAVTALPTPPLRRVVAQGLVIASASFVVVWIAVAATLAHLSPFAWRPLDWLVDVAGGLAVLALSWLLFPAVVTLVMSFFLERVVAAVEERDYPGRGPPRRQPLTETVAGAARLMAVAALLNLLALPVYLFVPGMNLILFLVLNGYLLGREYFEVVALRRLDAAAARAVRNRFGGRIFIGGIVIAGLFALPLVNLAAPVVATAFMLHVFEALPHSELHPLTRSAV